MSTLSALRIIIGLVATLVVAGVVAYVSMTFIFPNHGGGNGPTPPPPAPPKPVIPETKNIWVHNMRTEGIYVVPDYGTATDAHNPRYTNWEPAFGKKAGANAYTVPHTDSLKATYIAPGATGTFMVFTAGMASLNLTFRVNCHPEAMICKYGDSFPVQDLDFLPDGQLKRDQYPAVNGGPKVAVPFKPAVDTRVEITWGCAYDNRRLCGVNPSCITAPLTCGVTEFGNVNFEQFMASHPGAKFHQNGLLYGPDGANIPLLLQGQGGVTGTPLGGLDGATNFDITCVDGFTVPMRMCVQRPSTSQGQPDSTLTRCRATYSGDAPILDPALNDSWQTVADTRFLGFQPGLTPDTDKCPTSELIFPGPRSVISLPGGPLTDGYNPSAAGTVQYRMPYTLFPNTLSPFKSTFTQGATTDLHMYRNPTEVNVMKLLDPAHASSWSIEQVIGCASACSVLTKLDASSQQFPIAGGHAFSTPSYFADTTRAPPTTENGIAEICCVAPIDRPTPYVVTDAGGPLQAHTSKWWVGNGTTQTITPPQAPNYAFGYYAYDFAVNPASEWWITGSDANPMSKNPYGGPPVGDESHSDYIFNIRKGATGQQQTTRAYTYAFDDDFSLIVCGNLFPPNLLPEPDARGLHYEHYNILIEVHPDPTA